MNSTDEQSLCCDLFTITVKSQLQMIFITTEWAKKTAPVMGAVSPMFVLKLVQLLVLVQPLMEADSFGPEIAFQQDTLGRGRGAVE